MSNLPEALALLLTHTRFTHIHHSQLTTSTNSQAMQAAAEGAPEGSVFITEEQTAGRGRGDHTWHSERSQGIYLSVILRPQLAPGDVIILSLAAGLAVYHAVKEVTTLEADLKWPNDLLLGKRPTQRKFCGILAEMSAEILRVRHLVIGIGINVNQSHFPSDLANRATSLCLATGEPHSRLALTAAVLRALDREYTLLLNGGTAARTELIRRFEARSSMAHDRTITVGEAGSKATLHGTTAGLNHQGFLLLRNAEGGGIEPIHAGTIQLAD